jgi:hypothetical protein
MHLAVDYVWHDPKGDGFRLARKYGLNSPQAIMCSAPETGDGLYMFKSDNKFYIWDEMVGDVWEITKSQDLNEILGIMHKSGPSLGPLKLKPIT